VTTTSRLTALKDLLARVKKAMGADREIDAAVWLETTPGASRWATTFVSSTGLWPDYTIDETRDATGRLIIVPPLTSSIDALVALAERVLPENHDWQLCKGGGCTIIYGNTPDGFDILDTGVQSAPTPALGFLSAILRALIAIEEN
jgi:hypothetical protein